MHLTSAVLLVTLLSLPPLYAQPQLLSHVDAGVVRSDVEKVYYDVEGATPDALADQLGQLGPLAKGKRYFGMTEWEVNTEYRWRERPDGCAIDDLTVRVSVQTRLPRWRQQARAPATLRGAWSRFLFALDHHEDGHRVLAEEAADAIRRKLASVRTTTCTRVEARAQREVVAVLNEYERRNFAYDVETGHGRTQGAVWPPAPWLHGTH